MNLIVRQARGADLHQVARLGVHFAASPPYCDLVPINPDAIRALSASLIEQGGTFVAQIPGGPLVGMLASGVVVHPISGELTGSEVAWWLEPEHRGSSAGVRLLHTAEDWARQVGATSFQTIAPAGETRLPTLYARRGYVEVETTWQKPLRQ